MKTGAAFITGAGSGIGRATAMAYAQAGIPVAVVDFSEQGANETIALIRKNSDVPADAYVCDVSIDGDVSRTFFAAVERFGHIRYAFNNAGVEGDSSLLQDVTDENWDGVLNVNLRGVWLCMKYQLYHMAKAGGGSIVNCSSIAGLVGFENLAPYVASKHGVIGLTKAAALEYAKKNIRVNAVCPGVIKTPMLDRAMKHLHQDPEQFAKAAPIGRMGTPQEIAETVLWLNSDKASFVTGHSLIADGGWTAQ
ncbi:SDR family oxidoreductase [Bdellovibrio bacteriovorus]|uniref:2,5-dichloro-2,5-cyclohexadiene-1,4-diol dehydrogenase n=1 Tax=Bdellovibrio bacteriovorus (strain ATCC 15356 / DSM 50701 / NCIMB 9529 / HD100) TaxID=264462 RepID=Q6MGV7_BDEBA|nr:SDR family oxidoreductase [Bdellovibrio bacteriovorus]AHZ85567.1 3-oxoacyl-ACP reductase [Bdellovibrio bacteriovorus]BEV70113.1 Levodione reductase [Bdellovibrio bacteriovorus]CAE81172.1 2,5-dichloro-2,5-cyclohexadiene-1,4-diol dehydrogenase [Bdellovibrio bacteriovorus HD100]